MTPFFLRMFWDQSSFFYKDGGAPRGPKNRGCIPVFFFVMDCVFRVISEFIFSLFLGFCAQPDFPSFPCIPVFPFFSAFRSSKPGVPGSQLQPRLVRPLLARTDKMDLLVLNKVILTKPSVLTILPFWIMLASAPSSSNVATP